MHTHSDQEYERSLRLARHRSSVRALMTTSLMATIYCGVSVTKYLTLANHALSSDIRMWGIHAAVSVPLLIALVIYTDWFSSHPPEREREQQLQRIHPGQGKNSSTFNWHETQR
jgi:stringent starvation protein B